MSEALLKRIAAVRTAVAGGLMERLTPSQRAAALTSLLDEMESMLVTSREAKSAIEKIRDQVALAEALAEAPVEGEG